MVDTAVEATLVTGGSGGLGAAVVRRLASRGPVALTYRSRPEAAQELVDELAAAGRVAAAFRLDVTDPDAVAAAVAEVCDRFDGIRTLVHAAGPHVPMVHLSRVDPRTYARQLEAEAGGFFAVVHACLPALRESSGAIVAITTAATSRYPVRDGLSAGTKGAIDQLVRAFAAEEGRYGVRVNAVGPGMLTDGMAERLISSRELDERALSVARERIPLGRFGTADDIAAAVEFLASDAAQFITGQKLDVDGGYSV
ncbi:SDR family oxidoreductase [Rhodococcus sp. D2-41]|uniref:SDR family oxidoreductase n=1 Tax=Speluncibacter jeojiensis TaxID=2710754 RepID=A0A9X4RDV7_9ACTN|nr:SDR family oxidoreductase [Rhodococcus sp. D2-41]MDG3011475.1 SDR family oxidoreductase [Rhodococcus sp. D2-41]MDG3015169.1 SDR family oxidoreductase [Corynebacteriales bacterium D3-21]